MIILAIILGLIMVFVLFLLFSPLQLEIDSDKHLFECRMIGLGGVRLLIKNDEILIKLKIPFYQKLIYPLRPKIERRVKEKVKKEKSIEKKKTQFSRKWLKKGVQVCRSFKVIDFKLNLDTDNYVLNSYLVPIFFFIDHLTPLKTRINYTGQLQFRLFIENKGYRILKAIIF